MKKFYLFPIAIFLATTFAYSQSISLGSLGSPYTQDFNTLATSGTSSSMPSGWVFLETGTAANSTYTGNSGTSSTFNTYSYGVNSGDTDRAFGIISGDVTLPFFPFTQTSLFGTVGAQFTNNTGSTIEQLEISYRGEMWRLETANGTDRLDFQYSTDATSLSTGTWTDVNQLDFSTPDTGGSPPESRIGNNAPNNTNLSHTITGLSIADGTTFWIRWSDIDDPNGADDGLSVDDFSLTPLGSPQDVDFWVLDFPAGSADATLQEGDLHTVQVYIITSDAGSTTASASVDIALNVSSTADASDFVESLPIMVTFNSGTANGSFQTVTLTTADDGLIEGDEDAIFDLTNATYSVGNATINTTSGGFGVGSFTITIQDDEAPPYLYRTAGSSGNWNTAATWEASPNGTDWSPSPLVPDNTNSTGVTILNAHTVDIPTTYTATIQDITLEGSGQLDINSGGSMILVDNGVSDELTFAGVTNRVTVNGSLFVNQDATMSGATSARLIIGSTGFYYHNYTTTGGTVYNADWQAGATLEFSGYTNPPSGPSGLNQSFKDIVWDCSSQTVSIDLGLSGTLPAIQNMLIRDTGSSYLALSDNTFFDLTVNGSFLLEGTAIATLQETSGGVNVTVGNMVLNSSGTNFLNNGNGNVDFTITGDVTHNSGTLDISAGTGNTVFNIQGNYNYTGGNITQSGSGTVTVNFTNNGAQTWDSDEVVGTNIDYNVLTGSILTIPDNKFISSAGGSFSIAAGAELILLEDDAGGAIRSTNNAGSIRVPLANRTYANNSTITYQNSGAKQFLGDGFPASASVDLRINNANDVELSGNATINNLGSLDLVSGALIIGNNTLTLDGVVNVTSGTLTGGASSNLAIGGTGAFGTLPLTSGSTTLNNFTINRTSSGSVTLGSDLTIFGTFTQTNGNLILGANNTLTLDGDYTLSSGSLVGSSTASLVLSGSGSYSPFSINELNSLTLSNSVSGASLVSSLQLSTLSLVEGILSGAGGITILNNGLIDIGDGQVTVAMTYPTLPDFYDVAYSNGASAVTTGSELGTPSTPSQSIRDFTVNSGSTVNVDRSFIVNQDLIINSGNLNMSTENLNLQGNNFTINTGNFTSGSGTVVFDNAGTINLGGSGINNVQFNNVTVTSGTTLDLPNANINISGVITGVGLVVPNSGTITLNGTVSQSVSFPSTALNNIVFAGTGTKNFTSDLFVGGNLTINSGVTVDVDADQDIEIAGIWSNSGTFLPQMGTVTFNGGTQSIESNGNSFHDLVLSGGTVTKTLVDALVVGGDLTIQTGVTLNDGLSNSPITIAGNWTNDGTFAPGSGSVTFNGTSIIGGTSVTSFEDINLQGNVTAPNANMIVTGNWTYTSGTFTPGTGTIIFSGGNENIFAGGQPFNNVEFGGTGTKTFDNVLTANDVTISAGVLAMGTNNVDVSGNWDALGGVITQNAANSLTFSGTDHLFDPGVSGYNDIILSNSGTVTLNSVLSVNGNLDINSTLAAGSSNIFIEGNWDATGGSFSSTGLTTFNGSSTQNITSNGSSFGGILVGGTGALLQDALVTTGDLTITSDLDIGANLGVTVGGNWDTGSGTFDPKSGLVTLNGSGSITTGTVNFNNLNVDGSYTLQDELNIAGSLAIANSLDAGADNDIVLSGNWTNDGTFIAQGGKITFDNVSDLLGSSNTLFNDMDVTGTSVNVQSSHSVAGTLTLVGSSTFDADGSGSGVFTFVSSADNPTIDGNLAAVPGTATFAGDATVQRYMSAEGGAWRYIASPVTGLTVADWQTQFPVTGNFTGADDLGGANLASIYVYDESNLNVIDSGWVAYPVATNAEAVTPGVGYSAWMRASQGQITIDQRGPVNQGSFNYVGLGLLTYNSSGSAADDGWNLIGNPYPSAIDWDDLWTNNGGAATNIDATISIRDFPSGQFATYNASTNTGTNGGTKNIAIAQAFWVHATGAPTLVLGESHKTIDSHTFFREETPIDYLRIALSDGASSDETLIHFFDDANAGLDHYDAYKLPNDIFNLSSLMSNGEDLVINAVGALECDSEVQLNITNASPGNYFLNFTEFESFQKDFDIVLQDNLTGDIVSVKANPIYQFEITADSASFGSERMKVIFTKPQINNTLAVTGDLLCETEVASVDVLETEFDVEYYLLNAAGVGVSDTLAGNGGDLMLIVQDSLEAGNHEFTVFAIDGCNNVPLVNKALVEVSSLVDIAQVIGGHECGPNAVLLQAVGADENSVYRWYFEEEDELPLAESSVGEYLTDPIDQSHTFFVAIANQLGCEGERVAVEASITNLDKPLISLDSLEHGVYTLTSSYDNGNQWLKDGEIIEGATLNSYIMTEPGFYSVLVAQEGCTVISDVYDYQDIITGIDDLGEEELITVYPNPFTSTIEVNLAAAKLNPRKLEIRVFDMSGKIVYYDKKLNNEINLIDLQRLDNGIYLINVYDGSKSIQRKIVKE